MTGLGGELPRLGGRIAAGLTALAMTESGVRPAAARGLAAPTGVMGTIGNLFHADLERKDTMLDVLIALVLFGLGYWLGRRGALRRLPAQAQPSELTRLQEDRAAFSQLMGYSAERAYGLDEQ